MFQICACDIYGNYAMLLSEMVYIAIYQHITAKIHIHVR
jgi:hypothetical protein